MTPTGTETEIRDHIRKRTQRRTTSKGAAAGSLHAGPGGWHKVIELLLEIGVLREYRRARGERGEQKFEIALLYRPGLAAGVPRAGHPSGLEARARRRGARVRERQRP